MYWPFEESDVILMKSYGLHFFNALELSGISRDSIRQELFNAFFVPLLLYEAPFVRLGNRSFLLPSWAEYRKLLICFCFRLAKAALIRTSHARKLSSRENCSWALRGVLESFCEEFFKGILIIIVLMEVRLIIILEWVLL